MSLSNNEWQALPGAPAGFRIFPMEKSPDVLCSNTYIVETPVAYAVIDPGSEPERIDIVHRVISEANVGRSPVFILLTHCHRDHARLAHELREKGGELFVIAATAEGARIHARGDAELTASAYFDEEPVVFSVDMRFFEEGNEAARHLADFGVTVERGFSNIGDKRAAMEILRFRDTEIAKVYLTPGHTPDSVCFRIGGVLFVGDILYAANPGIAGIFGWDRQGLLESLDHLEMLARSPGVSVCASGHGPAMTIEPMLPILFSTRAKTVKLDGVATLDLERARFLVAYAKALLNEAARLLAVMSGQLFALAFQLERLGEKERADRVLAAVDIHVVDKLLSRFLRYAEDFEYSRCVSGIVTNGVYIAKKIVSAFEHERLGVFIDASIPSRARDMLMDFMAIAQGFPLEAFVAEEDLNVFVSDFAARLRALGSEVTAEAFFQVAEDHDAFVDQLAARVARRKLFDGAKISGFPADRPVMAALDRDRVGNLLLSVLERIAAAGATDIALRVMGSPEGNGVRVEYRPETIRFDDVGEYARLTAALYAATLTEDKAHGHVTLLFAPYPPASV